LARTTRSSSTSVTIRPSRLVQRGGTDSGH